jgi:hypothetical protein
MFTHISPAPRLSDHRVAATAPSTISSPPDVGSGFAFSARHAAWWTATKGVGAFAKPAGARRRYVKARKYTRRLDRRIDDQLIRPQSIESFDVAREERATAFLLQCPDFLRPSARPVSSLSRRSIIQTRYVLNRFQ